MVAASPCRWRCRHMLGRRRRHGCACVAAAASALCVGSLAPLACSAAEAPPAGGVEESAARLAADFLASMTGPIRSMPVDVLQRGAGITVGGSSSSSRSLRRPEKHDSCLSQVRASLERCVADACKVDVGAACNGLIETPFCAEQCGARVRESYGFGLAASNSLGRTLRCVASRGPQEVKTALDLSVGHGDGSSEVLVSGLAQMVAASGSAAVLVGFETSEDDFNTAVVHTGMLPGVGSVTTFDLLAAAPDGGSELGLEALSKLAVQVVREAKPGKVSVLLIRGEAYPDGGRSPAERRGALAVPNALEVICEAMRVDLVFLEGLALDAEVALLQAHCQRLRWVLVNNANLPGHAGWVREHLLIRPQGDWAEVTTGRLSDAWAAGADLGANGGPLPRVYQVRAWSALARIPGLCEAAPDGSVVEQRAAAARLLTPTVPEPRLQQSVGLRRTLSKAPSGNGLTTAFGSSKASGLPAGNIHTIVFLRGAAMLHIFKNAGKTVCDFVTRRGGKVHVCACGLVSVALGLRSLCQRGSLLSC
eukprot:TRINITY_DN19899_c0_g1_i3.p1 TRINITY_DN19899_c0_g1~~TRINITY_DN19899_c0_g1_i3.p1  ORF type:complete len:536 (+),score=86.72 TRINITY_DN19899_c0_g1_i3:116-1723(+)